MEIWKVDKNGRGIYFFEGKISQSCRRVLIKYNFKCDNAILGK